MIPEDFITEKEEKAFEEIEVKNNYVIVKVLPLSKAGLVFLHKNNKGDVEGKHDTRGVVMALSNNIAKELNLKKGDIVGWSINNLHLKVIEIELQNYLMLTQGEIAYVVNRTDS